MCQLKKSLGEIVRETRKSKKMSQEVLAEKVSVCKRTIMDIERGTANPKFDLLYMLVRELNLPLNQIFYHNSDKVANLKEQLIQEVKNCSEKELQFILIVVKNLQKAWKEMEK